MIRTTICDLLGIRCPILQGGMLWIADAVLVSSVSNAGALGTISPYAGMKADGDPLDNLRIQIRKTRNLTNKPFAVNVPLDLPDSGLLINVLLEEGVRIVVTAAGSPELFTELLHSRGVRVLHVISSASQAQLAQSCGVDAVIAEGAEAGGRIGRQEISLLSLIPQVRDVVSIPVVAAGGIVDGLGMASAIVLGADGVQLGTRFIAATECIVHPNYKQAIVDASDVDSIIAGRVLDPARRLRNEFSLALAAKEQAGVPASLLRAFVGRGRARKAQMEGDLKHGDFLAGASVGSIKSVMPAAEIIEGIMRSCEEALR